MPQGILEADKVAWDVLGRGGGQRRFSNSSMQKRCYGTTLRRIEARGQGILTVFGTYSGQQNVGKLWLCVHVHVFMLLLAWVSSKFI